MLSLFGSPSRPDSFEHELIDRMPAGRLDDAPDHPGLGSIWRQYLSQLGVDAAIIHCEPLRPGQSKISYIVGLDELRKTPDTTAKLLSFARRLCRNEHAMPGGEPRCTNLLRTCARQELNDKPGELVDLPHAAAVHRRLEDYQVDAVFLRSGAAGDFTSETVATLHLTLPLFLCSASRQTALKRVQQQISVMRGMLDWLDLGMLVLDDNARVVTSNAAGDALIASERLLRIAPDGSLVCRRQADSKVLRVAIEQVCRAGRGKSEFVVKLGESDNRCRLGFVLGASPQGEPRWQSHALLLVLPARPAMVSREMLDTMGLLPSEQRFLLAFLEAGSLAEGASKAGVSEETAKTYLKRIRSKLGVRRQIELAQLIYGQSPPLRCALNAGHTNGGSHALV